MIDFIEYLVAELKSKRLSKANAVALLRQFSRRAPASAGPAAVLHPLLHRNTSDLSEQRYSTTLTGQEFFLTDHQVRAGGGVGQKVLPGVAYLEMARAAVEQAMPERPDSALLELHNVVWAQPLLVAETKEVSIALLTGDDDHIDFQIYSENDGGDFVHGQGRAVLSRESAPAPLDLPRLEAAMGEGELAPDAVYATCARMGLLYGPSFQAITAIRRGTGQALARLRLPSAIAESATDYVLHPSLLDGALQAAVGLMESDAQSEQPRLPFALEKLRVIAPCTSDMVAWVRYAPESHAAARTVKLDLDLCDERGEVCVQLRGLSWRVLSSEIVLTATERRATGVLLATPVWQVSDHECPAAAVEQHHIILCDLPLAPRDGCVSLQTGRERTLAERFSDHAVACFESIQTILRNMPQGRVLVQIVVADDRLAGLSGLLKTAALENPRFAGQLIIVAGDMTAGKLDRRLEAEKSRGLDPIVRYERGERSVQRWQEVAADPEKPPVAFRDQGVYLITGGLGGLGLLFAGDILAQAAEAHVVLTGRAPWSVEKQALLDNLSAAGRASYRQVDLGDGDAVQRLIDATVEEHGRLNGILHCAGMTADSFILQKSAAELRAILTPKVAGTLHLDEATRAVELDFFALFSAIAGVMGNLGQADYAMANAFMDQFAADRNRQVEGKQRHGRTRAIDWPLWLAGGMTPDRESRERLQAATGMQPMQTATGLDAFHRSVAMPHDQLLVVEGELAQLRRTLLAAPAVAATEAEATTDAVEIDAGTLAEKTQDYLRRQFSETLKVPAQKIEARAALENYGIDSILAMKLTNQLETTFGSLPKTLFFEYQTIRELAEYFVTQHAARLTVLFAPAVRRAPDSESPSVIPSGLRVGAKDSLPEHDTPAAPTKSASRVRSRRRAGNVPPRAMKEDEPIAIIGLSGRYPEAVDIEAYWTNLREGKDCITEVPESRWNWREYFSEDRTKSGHHYSKWGGFISGVDEFDPLFFNISPLEAETIDPQERLFLQHAWMAIEDAGYTRASLQIPFEDDLPGQVGVYAGVMYVEYQLFGAEAGARGTRMGIPGSAASVANRVSYALNLHGPSMTLDTMCSSSLTAIHIACQDLKQGRTSLAIAGGVNVTVHPNKYLVLSDGQFISSDGHCQSFGEGGDGYIPGEGVGVVVLKRLSEAERDGDHIYGVIRGTALTHGGKTNGYSVPNPQAQASAIGRALVEARTDARHISYLEAHGTGTKLGDPIEIAALSRTFARYTSDTGYCMVGSAKSNIGHCESAAGIAGLTKVLLQMQHRQIVPSLHSAQLNPHIDFEKTPFVVNQTLQPWEPPVIDGRTLPRMAGISSFGAGGSNAHMIVEEYQAPAAEPPAFATVLIVLSARTAAQLQQKAQELLDFIIPRQSTIDLASMAYTLQAGREAMEERLGFIISSTADLVEKLQAYVAGEQGLEDVHRGQAKRNNDTVSLFSTDGDLRQAIDRWIAGGKLSRLLDLWVKGLELDWNKLYGDARPRRMTLPVYPFARDRYWIDTATRDAGRAAAVTVLHPLLHSNTSDLTEQRYRSTFTGDEFFLADHQVAPGGQEARKVLPGVAYLEMVRAAMERAWPKRPESTLLELRDIVWTQPLVVAAKTEVSVVLSAGDDDQIAYEVYSGEAEEELAHCQGHALFSREAAPAALDLVRLQFETVAVATEDIYAVLARMGLIYGPSFRGITAIERGGGHVLAQLRLPDSVADVHGDYVLHPSLMDSALQAAVGLLEKESASSQPRLPFALDSLRIVEPCTPEMFAWVRYAPGSQASDSVVRLDIDLCDSGGNVSVQMRGLSSRTLSHELGAAAVPRAEASIEETQAIEATIDGGSFAEQTQDYLRRQLAGVLKLSSQSIDPHAALEDYGIDSVLAMKLTNQLEKTFGALPKTLFFEYQTIHALAEYFAAQHTAQVTALLRPAGEPVSPAAQAVAVTPQKRAARRRFRRERSTGGNTESEPIAIIGLSGRYPQAVDVEAYWRNLRDGKDCITEVPKERWDWREYFSDDRTQTGRHFSKWGGFITGVDEFDPLFFNISPVDAELIDPQERLFLQHAWMAVEDAGYTRAGMRAPETHDLPGQVGVYAGVMYNEYQLFAAEANARGRRLPIPGSTASVANRVSYCLNLHGPSVTLDTMCSSSLTAIHFACQDLKLGRTSMAIAGGVNVTIHPNKYLVLSTGQFISSDGHCQSFGEGGDGYIPGEGVGVAVLKRLSDAKRDGDHIYGVIRGSALNHGGKTNGYTVPNPQAQAGAIRRALEESGTDPRHISYIEAHGTGTTLGDPIEIAALSKAFQQQTRDTAFCLIGSAKSNIGHCESAAGIAGLTKVLLQFGHEQIVPSLHSAQLNPHIDFASTPFIVNQTLRPWEQPVVEGRRVPRIAGISSFGAGGSNAHLIVEEYRAPVRETVTESSVAILLSARAPEQLRQRVRDLAEFLQSRMETLDLTALAYTLQVGREAMEERLGFVAGSNAELARKLQAYLAGEQAIEDVHQGQARRGNDAMSMFSADADLQQTVEKWIAGRKLSKLLDLWVKGLELDWSKLYGQTRPPRISLPVYPFAKEHYWIDTAALGQTALRGAHAPVLHPLLHANTSDLSEQRYRSTFTGEEFFLADHQVRAAGKVLPGVAQLEMARAAIELAWPERPREAVLQLRDVVWLQPVVVSEAKQIHIVLTASGDGQVEYEIISEHAGEEIVHGQGRAMLGGEAAPERLDIEQLEARMTAGALDPRVLYSALERMGLLYGPAFQGIVALRRGDGEVLARLRLPASVAQTASDYVLHPSLMDGAFQAAAGLLDDLSTLSHEPRLPFALESLQVVAPCSASMVAWVRSSPGSRIGDPDAKLDIDLCDERGDVCVRMRGFASRVKSAPITTTAATAETTGVLYAAPLWQSRVIAAAGTTELTEHHVVLCELAAERLESLLPPRSLCLRVQGELGKNVAQRYSDGAVACFERVQAILRSKPVGDVLVQIVVADDGEHALFAGLSGLLKTAAAENPRFAGQLILVAPDSSAEELARHLEEEKRARDPLVRYRHGARQVMEWQEVPVGPSTLPFAFKDHGVYLITGGAGGLGLLFASDIVEGTRDARVILTGRAPWSEEKQAVVEGLGEHHGRVTYRPLDLSDAEQVKDVVRAIVDEHGRLDGILHSAGMVADRFILRKSGAEFASVLEPKVAGTFHLDAATGDIPLDFFVLFSSIAGAMGNPGQADYATANAFMDRFAAHRNALVSASQRHGRTLSINWPLWQGGGMRLDAATQELLRQTTGMLPLQTRAGLEAFHRCLASPHDQMLVVEGDVARIGRMLFGARDVPVVRREETPVASETLAEKTQDYLRREFAGLLKLPFAKIDPHAVLEKYGIDSILAMRLTNQLELTFGSLSKTLFFEYQTIAALAGYLVKAHADVLRDKLDLLEEKSGAQAVALAGAPAVAEIQQPAPARRRRNRFLAPVGQTRNEIAIVGLAGRYPQAENLAEFWRNLKDGRDCITEIPPDRWDHSLYFDPDPNKPGKSYSKWGGFIADTDKFDPLFFNISPKEAELIDPQERLFLETVWETIEDAGYTKESIAGRRVGVFAGVMWGQYELFGAESLLSGNPVLPGSSHGSIANRVSYFFDFHGPSIALDTMCSSSLTAIHLACEELRKGELEAAIAGGVNLTVHPYKYLGLSQGKFAASDGRCRSFGAGGDGYVPGEGVGAVLLKPLENALRDGDQIYGVIRSSSVNHGGKTNGYTVPNPNAQGDLIRDALRKANVDPKTLSYIETHGTGTSLGDPIEIAGLSQAFEGSGAKQSCPIGSVKSNIGHLESAAGIAAVTKALLQLRYKQLVPSLHAEPLNPHINFADSPFYVQTELADWARPAEHPRRVGVSSFGAGGSNAHLIIEELDAFDSAGVSAAATPQAFVLSARTPDALRRYAERVVRFLENAEGVSLASVAYTSQVGRTPMEARLAVIASSLQELGGKLAHFLSGSSVETEGVFHRNLRDLEYSAASLITGPAGKVFLDTLLSNRELAKIARLWVLGADVDWSVLHRQSRPRRVSLPTYPFAKERCWIQEAPRLRLAAESAPQEHAVQVRRSAEPVAAQNGRISYSPPMGAGASDEADGALAPQEKAALLRDELAGHDWTAQVRHEGIDLTALSGRTELYLKALIGEELKLAPERIGSADPLESFGIDSVMIQRINAQLERNVGALPKTLLYEHETVRELAAYLVRTEREALITLFELAAPPAEPALPAIVEETRARNEIVVSDDRDPLEPIAIIGIHGYYPHSATLADYWENLRQGRDLIELVPPDRWSYQEFYDPDPAAASDGKLYCKWGGFLADYDKFDPHFFKISTAEAKVLDPQERMFLESVWAAFEDAGYTRDRLRAQFPKAGSADVGVFAGVTTNSYDLRGPEERMRGNFVSPTSLPWSIANRVSYFFDLNGPSLPVDTACSSSLVAIHLACEALRNRDCRMAIAGGVNLYLHPAKYQSLCQKRMVSRDGKCHSYGAGDDGFVPGEGVGTLVLKPLSKAIEDHDQIHALIRSTAYEHSGRSNGYSAPNPNAQANLISHTLEKAGIHPETISYVEGHGTGTQLGDSIEIAALTKAFRRKTAKTAFCPIGSVKANIGHSESAAGIAGVAKVVLQMQHGQLAPSIHSEEPNPNIEFHDSPFYLQHGLAEWPASPDHPRRALINSFGAGGVNACVVVEEYRMPAPAEVRHEAGPYLFVLSARNEERLRDYADRLLGRLRKEPRTDLANLCYTLQAGREAMEERLAIVVADVSQLIDRLADWTRRGAAAAGAHRGSLAPRRGSKRSLKLVRTGSEEQSLTDLASRWVAGEEVEWESLYAAKPRRISAPTYPFARERYWVSDSIVPERPESAGAHLHPLIAYNSSTLREVNFNSSLCETAFYATDHQVHDERIFPGAAFLEMACIAGTMAAEQRVRKIKDVVWIQPLSFRSGAQTLRTVLRRIDDGVEYVISSFDDDNEPVVHSEGRLAFGSGPAIVEERIPPHLLKADCATIEDGASYYERFRTLGLHYGPSFQTIQELFVNGTSALAKLRIADHLRPGFGHYLLHPSLIDGALQTIAALGGNTSPGTTYLPFALDEVEILGPVPPTCYAYVERAGAQAQNHSGVTKFDIRILNESGEALVKFKNLYVRPLATPLIAGHSAAHPGAKGRLISLSGGAIE